MKTPIIFLFLIVSLVAAKAQTNLQVDLSNMMVIVSQLKSEVQAAKSNLEPSQVQTVTYSNGVPVATNVVTVPVSNSSRITSLLGSAATMAPTIGGLLALMVVIARGLRMAIPDKSQVNNAGVLLARLGGEINASKAKLAAAAANPSAPVPTNPTPVKP
jgi:hypothetical protein